MEKKIKKGFEISGRNAIIETAFIVTAFTFLTGYLVSNHNYVHDVPRGMKRFMLLCQYFGGLEGGIKEVRNDLILPEDFDDGSGSKFYLSACPMVVGGKYMGNAQDLSVFEVRSTWDALTQLSSFSPQR